MTYIVLQSGKKFVVAKKAVGGKHYLPIATCDYEHSATQICEALNLTVDPK